MAREIERKFLVSSDAFKVGVTPVFIRQGFISADKDNVVRVRIQGTQGFLTLKGSGSGISRIEFDYEIPLKDADEMLKIMCSGIIIEKFRYVIKYKGHTWEVDEFMKENSGLVVAEIELKAEDEAFHKPPWTGKEITGDPVYYNVNLIQLPYSKW